MFEKSSSSDKSQFGKGDPRGIAAPEAGNNAAAGGALVPMLTLGVPGSGTTAVLLALLMTLNITPGPLLFTERPEVVWGLIASLLIANIVLLILNVPMVKIFSRLLEVPASILLPGVTMISFVGIYSLSGSYFDLLLMIGFGMLGYFLRKLSIPTVPVILGILLGGHMEVSLRRAMVLSDGDWTYLFSSSIAVTLWVAAFVGFIAPLFLRRFLNNQKLLAEIINEHKSFSSLRVLGLGFSEKALESGLKRNPDIISIDGGSTDSGPFYLGTGTTKYSEEICKKEWRVLMQARHRLNIPLMIGSCGTCGTNSMVDWMFQLTLEIAKDLGQDLKIVRVYCEREKDALLTAFRSNALKPLNPILSISEEEIGSFSNIVALAGAEVFQSAINQGRILCSWVEQRIQQSYLRCHFFGKKTRALAGMERRLQNVGLFVLPIHKAV